VDFDRTEVHYSSPYFGSYFPAVVRLVIEKRYTFVGSNSSGNTAYFIRDDRMNDSLIRLAIRVRWVESRFRVSRDKNCRWTWLRGVNRGVSLGGLSCTSGNWGSGIPMMIEF